MEQQQQQQQCALDSSPRLPFSAADLQQTATLLKHCETTVGTITFAPSYTKTELLTLMESEHAHAGELNYLKNPSFTVSP